MAEAKKEIETVKSAAIDPLPRVPSPKPIELSVDEQKKAALYVVYALFRSHMFSRHNLRQILNVLKEAEPTEGIVQYLVNEGAKA